MHDLERLSEESERALAEAARIAVPHVIQARAARDVDRRMRAEMVLAVLEGRRSSEETASRLGFAPAEQLSLLAFRLTSFEPAVDGLKRERLVDLVGFYCEVFRRSSAAVAVGENVYVFLQGEPTIGPERLVRLAHEIQAHAETRLGVSLLAAIGSTVENVHDVPRVRREVENVLTVLGNDAKGRSVATVEEVRTEVVILELCEASAGRPGLMRGKLERVLAYDSIHDAEYTRTLRAYLDAFGDVARRRRGDRHPPEHVPLPTAPARRALRPRAREPGGEARHRAAAAPARGRQVSTAVVTRSRTSGSGVTPSPGPIGTARRPASRTNGSVMSSS